jgi:hypothetical protein
MVAPCVRILADGNEAKTHARDLNEGACCYTHFPTASAST